MRKIFHKQLARDGFNSIKIINYNLITNTSLYNTKQ